MRRWPNPVEYLIRRTTAPSRLYHATPEFNLFSILRNGLVPSSASLAKEAPGVFLSDQKGVARSYAETRFGLQLSDYNEPWVLLEIDGNALDANLLRPDRDIELDPHIEKLQKMGYSRSNMPWWVSLEFSGQVVYGGVIPPSAIKVVERMLAKYGDERNYWVAVPSDWRPKPLSAKRAAKTFRI